MNSKGLDNEFDWFPRMFEGFGKEFDWFGGKKSTGFGYEFKLCKGFGKELHWSKMNSEGFWQTFGWFFSNADKFDKN